MNRESEEQQPVSQTFCGALQKEPNCKCLVLSVLIYGCLAAVTWCRCANVTKIVINFSKYPIKSTKHVSPCDDGYIYIPVAFMGMLYLVYLVECYHSPIRIDLSHAESQDCILAKLMQLRLVQPTIWWKAVSYHYVRRKRQITRYRNGDNYTTTQVYYERVNTHAATSFYYYEYCGVKDISKELIPDPKIPITKIQLTKGFAFSNIRSATEFEEARSRFFAEQELRDDYTQMTEGLDLGCHNSPTMLVAVLGNPWFTNRYVYWCLSALLLSWPLRVIIEYNTQYADYQVTKLFGVNYDTPLDGELIRASTSQLSQPGSYMLAPSYSEALLMEPVGAGQQSGTEQVADTELNDAFADMSLVPSYSEALLYQRAEDVRLATVMPLQQLQQEENQGNRIDDEITSLNCDCPCHRDQRYQKIQDYHRLIEEQATQSEISQLSDNVDLLSKSNDEETTEKSEVLSCSCSGQSSYACTNIVKSASAAELLFLNSVDSTDSSDWTRRAGKSRLTSAHGAIAREISEPNFRYGFFENLGETAGSATSFFKSSFHGRSLKNIVENEEESSAMMLTSKTSRRLLGIAKLSSSVSSRAIASEERDSLLDEAASAAVEETKDETLDSSRGAIPKKRSVEGATRCRVIVNPRSHETRAKMPISRTYLCLKSILKQNRRRYTLVTTAQELENLGDWGCARSIRSFNVPRLEYFADDHAPTKNVRSSANGNPIDRDKNCSGSQSRENLSCVSSSKDAVEKDSQRCFTFGSNSSPSPDLKHETSRTLIFASPIQEICPGDPFGGKSVVSTRNRQTTTYRDEAANLPMLTRLRRSLTERESSGSCHNTDGHKTHWRRSCVVDGEHVAFPRTTLESTKRESNGSHGYRNGVSFPPYDGFALTNENRTIVGRVDDHPQDESSVLDNGDRRQHQDADDHANDDENPSSFEVQPSDENGARWLDRRDNETRGGWQFLGVGGSSTAASLTRSMTERRPSAKDRGERSNLRRSLTGTPDLANYKPLGNGGKRTNLSMETSL